ncbi:hypothetical protein C4577_05755 [Candidatus Parcubacteria bacterium]|nr:MAG: hypothetical protein C4577_05755 [Candidatus Parcubacteria bacterium]
MRRAEYCTNIKISSQRDLFGEGNNSRMRANPNPVLERERIPGEIRSSLGITPEEEVILLFRPQKPNVNGRAENTGNTEPKAQTIIAEFYATHTPETKYPKVRCFSVDGDTEKSKIKYHGPKHSAITIIGSRDGYVHVNYPNNASSRIATHDNMARIAKSNGPVEFTIDGCIRPEEIDGKQQHVVYIYKAIFPPASALGKRRRHPERFIDEKNAQRIMRALHAKKLRIIEATENEAKELERH